MTKRRNRPLLSHLQWIFLALYLTNKSAFLGPTEVTKYSTLRDFQQQKFRNCLGEIMETAGYRYAATLSQSCVAVPRFSKVYDGHIVFFAFTKDLYYYLFSLTERNLKRIFTFTEKKKQKTKIVFSVGFAVSLR